VIVGDPVAPEVAVRTKSPETAGANVADFSTEVAFADFPPTYVPAPIAAPPRALLAETAGDAAPS